MLKICERHLITYDHHEQLSGCPVCHLEFMVDERDDEIKELKAEIKELKLQCGANILEEIQGDVKQEEGDIPIVPMDTPNPPHGE